MRWQRGQRGDGDLSGGCQGSSSWGSPKGGAPEPVSTAGRISFKGRDDVWAGSGCDRGQVKDGVGWGAQEDAGDKLGPEGMRVVRGWEEWGGEEEMPPSSPLPDTTCSHYPEPP